MEHEVSNKTILEQVLIDSDVVDFKVLSTDALSSRRSRSQESFSVTFEISLTASEDVDMIEMLSGIFSVIDYFEPDSVVVIEQYNEKGRLSDK